MVVPEDPREGAPSETQPTSPDAATREPWSTPTLRVLAAADTEGGLDGFPVEGTFYGPFS
jgi:hypothetical protein